MRGTALVFALIVVGFILLIVKVRNDRQDAQDEAADQIQAR